MHSQANAWAGKVVRPSIRALPSVIVVTEKVMREADGAVGRAALTAHFGWKGDRPGVHLESLTGELVRSPKITSAGTENIHLDTGPPNARRRSKRFSWRISRVSRLKPQDSCQDAGEARNDSWSSS